MIGKHHSNCRSKSFERVQ